MVAEIIGNGFLAVTTHPYSAQPGCIGATRKRFRLIIAKPQHVLFTRVVIHVSVWRRSANVMHD